MNERVSEKVGGNEGDKGLHKCSSTAHPSASHLHMAALQPVWKHHAGFPHPLLMHKLLCANSSH